MMDRIEKFLQDIAMIPALAGFEQKMAAYMHQVFIEAGHETIIDNFGNCIAKSKGRQADAPVTMVFSHMDSLGFLVRYIEPNGFLRIERLGGIPEKALPATQVQVQCGDGSMIDGVIGTKAHHITPAEEKYVVERYKQLFVDIGAASKQEVLDLGIDIGSPIVYKPRYEKLLGDRVLMTSVDDRGGCSVILDLAFRLKHTEHDGDIYLVGTVQEEYNLRGAMMASRSIRPDIGICLDVGGSTDTPDLKGFGEITCGGGPIMSMYNFHGRGTLNGTIPHPAMVRLFEEAARRTGIPLQRSAQIGGLTDLAYLQLEGKGVYSIDMGYPGRYTHSSCEVIDMTDLEKLSDLVLDAILHIDKQTDFSR